MPYTLNVHVREAEPYTGLWTYDDVREAVEEEVRTTVDQLGSDILNEGTEAERDLVVEHLADAAMMRAVRLVSLQLHRVCGGGHGSRR